ncbi:MAG: hypothetical protein KGI29_03355 [Pseudomonadota bacterium]|nr:hypothetical protein [Pseudomonadota bacterium]MDE3037157.1 hypothetical protein [Pseudomonadota bacterium]
MSVGSISTLPPALQQITQPQPQNSQKPATQTTAAQPVAGGDSDGDSDGSGGASVNITPPVNIKA